MIMSHSGDLATCYAAEEEFTYFLTTKGKRSMCNKANKTSLNLPFHKNK